MVLKSCRIALEWVVGLLAGLAIFAGLLLFYLSREPLPVDFLAPYLETALSRQDGIRVEVGETQLRWAGWGSRIEVAAQDWKVYDSGGSRVATVPDASIELSLSALVSGQVAPTSIKLSDLRISLLRHQDGHFSLDRPEPSEVGAGPEAEGAERAAAPEQPVLRLLFSELGSKPDPNDPFAQLAKVTVVDASAVLVDRQLGTTWQAPEVSLEIRRDTSGIQATGAATLALGDRRAQIDLTMSKHEDRPGMETVVDIDSLEPSAFAAVFPRVRGLEGIKGGLTGRVGLTMTEDGRPTDMVVELGAERLTVDLPQHLEQPLAFRQLELKAHGTGLDDPIVVERLAGSIAPASSEAEPAVGPSFSLKANVGLHASEIRLEASGEVRDVPAADLSLYWPKDVGGNGRPWVVENITDGLVTSATIATTLTIDRESGSISDIEDFGGRFLYQGLEVHYLRPMPPMTGAVGSATYGLNGLDFTVEEAHRGEITISNGGVSIFGLEGEDHRISIVFGAAGPLQAALTLLDHERLGLLDNLGLDPETASGSFQSKVSFAFPLEGDLTFEQVQIGVESEVSDVGLKGGVAGHDLEEGRFDLTLDATGLEARGNAKVAGIPMDATWRESFEAVERPTHVTATVPSARVAELAVFGLEAGDYAEGLLSAQLNVAANHQGDSEIGIAADLTEVEARVQMLGWEKPRGRPGTLKARLDFSDGNLTRVGDLAAEFGDDVARGEIAFAGDGTIERATFDQLALGRNAVTGLEITPLAGGGHSIFVRTGVLDLAPLLGRGPEDRPPEGETETAEQSGPPYTPLRLESPSLARVRLAKGRSLENATLEMERNRQGWQLIRAQAQIPRTLWRHQNRPVPEDANLANKSMSLYYRPEGDGTYRLELFADDIGATLRALGWFESLEGGKGEIVATLPGPFPDAPVNGRLETKGFRIVEAPAMAKLLTVASLTGIGNLLSGEGIEFDRAVGQFTLDNDVLRTPLFRAYGSSLGITAKGQVDLEGDQTDIAGTLVPAYSVNRILGEIPILGQILTGGEGEGILGVTYRVTGRIEDPEVSVNPLSLLAPGFLRGLFSVPGPDSDEPPDLTDVFPSGEEGR